MSIKLEVGKRYVRRDGVVTGYLRPISSALYPYHDPKGGLVYTAQGINDINCYSPGDLIEEYVESEQEAEALSHLITSNVKGPTSKEIAPLKLEIGKRYVRRDGDVTGPLVDNSVYSLYPFKDPTNCQTYTSKGRYSLQNIQDADLVSEYVEPTPKQQGTLPAEPIPGRWYCIKDKYPTLEYKCMYVGRGVNGYYVYQNEKGSTYVSMNPSILEWKEPVVLPPVDIKRWYVVQSTDHPTLTTIKRGDVLFSASTKEEAEAYTNGDKDCEIVEVVGILPRKEVEG